MLLSKKETSILSNDEEGLMITKCQFNSSKSQRYLMDKIWNEDGKKAVFIGINPSYANGIKGDKTTMTVINYLIDDGFGSLTVLNLFSIIDVDTKSNNKKYATNFEHHREIFENADLILIGWGCETKKYSDQKEVAENILKEFSEKVYTFVDEKNRQGIHPSKMAKSSKLEQYNFMTNFVKTDDIYKDMCGIIESSREAAYRAVNTALVQRNWLLGYRIVSEELQGEKRAEYGMEVIKKLSKDLTKEYGKGFTKTNLYSFYSFYKMYLEIFQMLSGKFAESCIRMWGR